MVAAWPIQAGLGAAELRGWRGERRARARSRGCMPSRMRSRGSPREAADAAPGDGVTKAEIHSEAARELFGQTEPDQRAMRADKGCSAHG